MAEDEAKLTGQYVKFPTYVIIGIAGLFISLATHYISINNESNALQEKEINNLRIEIVRLQGENRVLHQRIDAHDMKILEFDLKPQNLQNSKK